MPWDFWLIFAVLAVLLPWRGRMRLQKLLAAPQITTVERLALYASTVAFQWIVAGVAAWRAWARGFRGVDLGLMAHDPLRIAIAGILGAVALAGLQWLNLRRVGKSSGKAREFMQVLAERILPQSRIELVPYLALAATAGLCEEFLYRGFAMAALAHLGLHASAVVLASSVLFGLAHLYQGRGGFVSTLVLGALFGAARIAYDSLLPVMAWHFAIDVVAGIAGPRYLLAGSQKPPTLAGPGQ